MTAQAQLGYLSDDTTLVRFMSLPKLQGLVEHEKATRQGDGWLVGENSNGAQLRRRRQTIKPRAAKPKKAA